MALYLINFSPEQGRPLPVIDPNADAMLLIGDGVYFSLTLDEPGTVPTYALTEDANTRGINLEPHLRPADYTKFLELTETYFPVVTW